MYCVDYLHIRTSTKKKIMDKFYDDEQFWLFMILLEQ